MADLNAGFKPSDADMDDFEKGLDAPQGEAPTQ